MLLAFGFGMAAGFWNCRVVRLCNYGMRLCATAVIWNCGCRLQLGVVAVALALAVGHCIVAVCCDFGRWLRAVPAAVDRGCGVWLRAMALDCGSIYGCGCGCAQVWGCEPCRGLRLWV